MENLILSHSYITLQSYGCHYDIGSSPDQSLLLLGMSFLPTELSESQVIVLCRFIWVKISYNMMRNIIRVGVT